MMTNSIYFETSHLNGTVVDKLSDTNKRQLDKNCINLLTN